MRTLGSSWILILVVAFTCQGCALSYIDSDGNRHVVGLVDVSIQSPRSSQTFAGDVVEIIAVGASVGQTAQGGYITLGYSREASAALRDNALVIGDPLHLLAQAEQKQPGAVP